MSLRSDLAKIYSYANITAVVVAAAESHKNVRTLKVNRSFITSQLGLLIRRTRNLIAISISMFSCECRSVDLM